MDAGPVNTKRIEAKDHAAQAPYAEALELAHRIEQLMTSVAGGASSSEAYSARLAQAITRSLIDQLSGLSHWRTA